MREYQRRFDAEFSGALTPELEGASHSRPHSRRPRETQTDNLKDRGETPSVKADLPSGPKQP